MLPPLLQAVRDLGDCIAAFAPPLEILRVVQILHKSLQTVAIMDQAFICKDELKMAGLVQDYRFLILYN